MLLFYFILFWWIILGILGAQFIIVSVHKTAVLTNNTRMIIETTFSETLNFRLAGMLSGPTVLILAFLFVRDKDFSLLKSKIKYGEDK